VTPARADRLLARANGRVKVALVMGRLGLSRARAEGRLAAAAGHLRRVIG
jgi:N-acetylmuramic acid 6-phosphate (MurNAc-6-P) etherase